MRHGHSTTKTKKTKGESEAERKKAITSSVRGKREKDNSISRLEIDFRGRFQSELQETRGTGGHEERGEKSGFVLEDRSLLSETRRPRLYHIRFVVKN